MDSVEPSVRSGYNLENFVFASNLNDYINEELVYLDNMNKPASSITPERFAIFKQAFDKVFLLIKISFTHFVIIFFKGFISFTNI
jgi:hypothetical protein